MDSVEAGASPTRPWSFNVFNRTLPCLLALVTVSLSGACSSIPQAKRHQANINHVVLVTLNDQAETSELLHDCDQWLLSIPDVRSYWAGTPLDIGRGDSVDGDYSVGLCVGFDDIAGYQAYLVHPDHVKLVEKWKPRWSAVRIFDVISDP